MGGTWRGRRIAAPAGHATRPTTDRVREAWMSVIAPELEHCRILDLYAGSGALGIEALSRGAAHATFVESAAAAVAVLEHNLHSLEVDAACFRIVRGDALRFVQQAPALAFDIVFADPPYDRGDAARLAEVFARHPFGRLFCLEHSPDELIDQPPVWQRRYGDSQLTFLRAPEHGT